MINQIFNENCLDTMARMPDNYIDLVVTSPPYDNLRTYNGYSFDFEAIAAELWRVVKPGGVIVWVVGDATVNGSETGTSFRQALHFKSLGFNLHDTMIFAKLNPIPLTHNRYEQQFEFMFVFSKDKPKTFNPILKPNKKMGKIREGRYYKNKSAKQTTNGNSGGTIKEKSTTYNIWFYYVGNRGLQKNGIVHPAMFPKDLVIDHINSWSNEYDIVYDPFMGSGTTALAAVETNRKYIGSEISKEYCDIIERRLNDTQTVPTLFE